MQTFVINLRRNENRLASITAALSSQNVDFERVDAVDGRELANPNSHSSWRTTFLTGFNGLTPGEVGCYLSHLKVWHKIVSENIQLSMVLEDDMLPGADLFDFLSRANIEHCGLHLLRLHISNPDVELEKNRLRKTSSEVGGRTVYIPLGHVGSTGAYLITLEGARRLSKVQTVDHPVDYFTWHSLRSNLQHGICLPPIFKAAAFESNIEPKQNIRRKYIYRFLKRRICPLVDRVRWRRQKLAKM